MAVDVMLWIILAGMAVWIVCGCVLTAPRRKQASLRDNTIERQFDRAA